MTEAELKAYREARAEIMRQRDMVAEEFAKLLVALDRVWDLAQAGRDVRAELKACADLEWDCCCSRDETDRLATALGYESTEALTWRRIGEGDSHA